MSGEADKAKGRIKQAAGDLTGDQDLRAEGERDETEGTIKGKIGEAEDKLTDAVDTARSKLDSDDR